jgi:hypothetical protein
MIIGVSRVGIGRLGMRGSNAALLELLTNASIQEYRYLQTLCNANIVSVFDLFVESNADIDDYNHRECLTNASIIDTPVFALLSNASIADLIALALSTNCSIVITEIVSMLTGASIIGPVDKSILTNASIAGEVLKEFLTNAYIAERIALELITGAYISEYVIPSTESNANIANLFSKTVATNADILDTRYWALGPEGGLIDLSGRVYDPKSKGFGLKTSQQRMPGGRRVDLKDEGLEGGEWAFTVVFRTDSERQTFQELINVDAENFRLHHGRSDRYHTAKKISVEPDTDDLWKGQASLKISCLMEDPYLYHALDQGLDLGSNSLPLTGISIYNYGSVDAPFLFRVGGFYSGGQLTLPYAKCMNASVEETSLAIGPGLLSNEYAELTLEGSQKYYLTHTYADDYSSNNSWQYDAVQSLCSLSGGQVSVPSGGWFYYKFQGQPTKENIKLLATITKTGSPIIQYSTDGATWYTALAATEITSAVQKTYYLTGTEKLSTVYVRFYSPTGSSMTIQDVSFSMERDISGQYDQIPMVPPGETRALKVTGSGSTKAKIKTVFRSRWYPQ